MRKTLRLYTGNSARYDITVSDTDGAPIDLTGSLVKFEVKKSPTTHRLDNTEDTVISKTSDDANEIEITDATSGKCQIKIGAVDTEYVIPGVYTWSVTLETGTGEVYTVASGKYAFMAVAGVPENMTEVGRH